MYHRFESELTAGVVILILFLAFLVLRNLPAIVDFLSALQVHP